MFDRALEINPNDPNARYNKGLEDLIYHIGISLSQLGKFKEAILMYDMALLINPNYSDAYYKKG